MAASALTLQAALDVAATTRAGWRVALCWGEDEAAVQDGARALTRSLAGGMDDPFRVLDVEAGQREEALAHVMAPPLTGGRAVVRVRGVTERHARLVADALGAPNGVFVMETTLPARSALIRQVAASRGGVVVGCARDGVADVRRALRGRGAGIDGATLKLTARWAASPGFGQFAEQLSLCSAEGAVAEADLAACVGETVQGDADAIWLAVLAGDARSWELLERQLSVGQTEVGLLRAGAQQVHRLRAVQPGGGAAWMPRETEAILRRLAPHWPAARLLAFGQAIADAEARCKNGRDDPRSILISLVSRALDQAGINRVISPSS